MTAYMVGIERKDISASELLLLDYKKRFTNKRKAISYLIKQMRRRAHGYGFVYTVNWGNDGEEHGSLVYSRNK